jgi:thiamine biosynthesis lipoprotein
MTPAATSPPRVERSETFACFGAECTVIISGPGAESAVEQAKRRLLAWHRQFSRFEPASELSLLNADPRPAVPVSPLMRRVLEAALAAARHTGGLVDATLGRQIECAGYDRHLAGEGLGLARLLALAPRRAQARPHPDPVWRRIVVDRRTGTISRPPGTRIDPGGIAKGVFADELGSRLGHFDAFAVDCAGDIRLGGRAAQSRDVHVASPFDDSTLHTFRLSDAAIATSGIGKRSWLTAAGRPAHHLLDPGTGAPAFTGIVQATALAPTATEAEMLSKAAVLSGPRAARRWLTHGGVIVFDDGRYDVISWEGR